MSETQSNLSSGDDSPDEDSSEDIGLGDYVPCGVCPACGKKLESGYGLAYGGGVGPYEFCEDEVCGYFHKWSDPT